MAEQPPRDHATRHVALLLLLKQWTETYQVDEETAVYELATATVELGFPIVMAKFWGLRHDPAVP